MKPIVLVTGKSQVHGYGLFAPVRIRNGQTLRAPLDGYGFNHSDCPNVTALFDPFWRVIAIRDIEAGEECFLEYGRSPFPPSA